MPIALIIPNVAVDGPVIDPDDQLLTDGSLFLFDNAHSANPSPLTAAPANGAPIHNLAWEKAAAVLGAGDATSLAGTFDCSASFVATDSSRRGGIELTPKGGLHVAVSQGSALTSTDGAHLQLPSALRSYFAANPSHNYFMSLWIRTTRADPSAGNCEIASLGMGSSTTHRVMLLRSHEGWSGSSISDKDQAGLNDTSLPLVRLSARNGSSNGTPTAQGRVSWGSGTGTLNAASSVLTSANGKWPSFVLYRLYVEDLTASERSYTDVAALDAAAASAALDPAGRYHGDTFTSPATLAP